MITCVLCRYTLKKAQRSNFVQLKSKHLCHCSPTLITFFSPLPFQFGHDSCCTTPRHLGICNVHQFISCTEHDRHIYQPETIVQKCGQHHNYFYDKLLNNLVTPICLVSRGQTLTGGGERLVTNDRFSW